MCFKNPVQPNPTANRGHGVGKTDRRFAGPGNRCDMQTACRKRGIAQGHDRVQTKQARSRPQDGVFRAATSRFQTQVRTHFLKRGFDRPAGRVQFDHSLQREPHIRGEKIFVAMRARQVAHIHPKDGHQADAVFEPMSRAVSHFDMAPAAAIPRDRQPFELFRLGDQLLRRGKLLAAFAWSAALLRARRRSIVQICVRVELAYQIEMLSMSMAEASQGMCTEAAVADKLPFSLGKPVDQHGQHASHQFGRRTMTQSVFFVERLAAIQGNHHRQRPRPPGKRKLHEDRQHDPFVSPPISCHRVCRTDGVAMATFAVDLLSRMPIDRIVARQGDGALGHPMFENERDQYPRQLPRCPPSHRKDAMIAARVSVSQSSDGAQHVADGPRPDRQHSCREDNEKPVIKCNVISPQYFFNLK